jgi:hypothetical protein
MTAPVSVLGGLAKDQRYWPDTPPAAGHLLLDTNFHDGPSGFTQLVATSTPSGIIGWTPNGNHDGGALTLNTCNSADGGLGHTECYVYRRLSRYAKQPGLPLRIKMEAWWSYQSRYGATNFWGIEFGFDQANSNGVRYYPNLRWHNSEDNTNMDQRWYVQTGSPTAPAYTLLPGPDAGTASGSAFSGNIQTNLGFNENKHNMFYTAFIYEASSDSTVIVYDGFQVGDRSFGSLVKSYVASNQAAPFAGGVLTCASAIPDGFPTTGTLFVGGVTGEVTYTGFTGSTFTGCTGGTGTARAGGTISLPKDSNPLRALSTTTSTLTPFSSGLNAGIGIRNRTSTGNAVARGIVNRVRVTSLPAAA